MKCVFCGYDDSKVIETRDTQDGKSIRRRRECLQCGKRFTTYEIVESAPVLVVKRDGTREAFDRNKIKNGIIKACEKRPVTIDQIERVVDSIEKEISNSLLQEVTTERIGEYVMNALKELDEVSYIRFASVYRQFKDVSTFIDFINENKKA